MDEMQEVHMCVACAFCAEVVSGASLAALACRAAPPHSQLTHWANAVKLQLTN